MIVVVTNTRWRFTLIAVGLAVFAAAIAVAVLAVVT